MLLTITLGSTWPLLRVAELNPFRLPFLSIVVHAFPRQDKAIWPFFFRQQLDVGLIRFDHERRAYSIS
jgi:hypothetical protein